MATNDKEVLSGTAVTLSCVITDITKIAKAVVWSKSDLADLSSASGYSVVQGTYGSNTQTSTLALTAAVNTADTTYTCKVTPDETYEVPSYEKTVELKVYSKSSYNFKILQFIIQQIQ